MTKRPRSNSGGRLIPPKNGAAIRMYRVGLGDCFLLAFDGVKADEPSYVLIDCGVHMAQGGGRATLRKAVDDIVRATGGRLNLVIATHEHTDHLSGFKHEAERFINDLKIDNLWLAWTEDDSDPVAKRLRRGRTAAKRAIASALEKLRKEGAASRPALAAAERLGFLASFDAEDEPDESASRAALAQTLHLERKATGNEIALALLRDSAEATYFFRPGHGPEKIPRAANARAYILGPPLEDALLKKSDASSGRSKETYLTAAFATASFAAAVGELDPGDFEGLAAADLCFPFDARYRGPGNDAFCDARYRHAEPWRRIDTDWLGASEQLALALANHTNNTSLVVAFELGAPGAGPVLLFSADAQVGSWLSWKNLKWGTRRSPVTVADLFARTAVYKVGHHGSHNATLRQDAERQPYGLELIGSRVVTLIPVDEGAATKLDWGMPHPRLYERLKLKSCGNVLRSDDGHDPSLRVPRRRAAGVPGVPNIRWNCSAETKDDNRPLYYDLQISAAE